MKRNNETMRIGIDCRTILNPEKGEGAGVGHYTYQLVRHLLQIDKKNKYVLLFDRSVEKRRLKKFDQKNTFFRFFPFIQYKKYLPIAYSHFLVTAFLNREKLDIFHSPIISLPLSYKKPSVITAHDIAIYKLPKLFPPRQVFSIRIVVPHTLERAKKIIAVSESTKKDLQEFFGLSSRKIEVVKHGLDKRFLEKRTAEEISRVKKKYGIKGDYILFVGKLEPRKNIIRIIEAYEQLREKITAWPNAFSGVFDVSKKVDRQIFSCQLVLAGQPGWQFEPIKRRIKQSKFSQDIIETGYVDPDDLDPLFEGAKVFLFPSLYEGFGLPIVEAMANQVPVITSNLSSMPEISKGAALLVNPHDSYEIAQTLITLLTDSEIREDLQKAGLKVAKQYSWEKTARETLSIYKKQV